MIAANANDRTSNAIKTDLERDIQKWISIDRQGKFQTKKLHVAKKCRNDNSWNNK